MSLYGYEEQSGNGSKKGQDTIIKCIVLGTGIQIPQGMEDEIPSAKQNGLYMTYGIVNPEEQSFEVCRFLQHTPKIVYQRNMGYVSVIKGGKMLAGMEAVMGLDGDPIC